MSPRSVFASLATEKASRARALDKGRDRPDETVLYQSDFDTGFDNWIDHWDAYRPWPVVSLTNHASHTGSRSLMLSTGEETYTAGGVANAPAVFKRSIRYRPDAPSPAGQGRFSSFSAWVGLGTGNYEGAWQEFGLFLDTNAYDNSQRSFFRLVCNLRPSPDFSRWQIAPNSTGPNITIPGSMHKMTGNNDNKVNFNYVRLTVDRAANSGLGGYYEAQVGPHVFDLTALGGGSAPEALQSAGGLAITEFNGGDNIGFGLTRSSTSAGGCQLFIDDVTYSVRDAA